MHCYKWPEPRRRETLKAMTEVLDDAGPAILQALAEAGMHAGRGPWRRPLSGLVEVAVRQHQERIERRERSELHRRARAYHAAHPGLQPRPRQPFYVKREHWLGVACGLLPEDRPYSERELSGLISAVGMDYAHMRRYLVDEGWMTRAQSTYRLTDLGRRAMRIEHVLSERCARSRPRNGAPGADRHPRRSG